MVKIVNPLGDIKTGRQGEAVYQRKYGEQMRRTVSPKRAIASKAQLAHRDLYRAALAWRKSLSLPNRRYLDGYCIANGIVDDYHIFLPWSRFALKLYLEKVRFVPALVLVEGEPGHELDQEYTTGDDGESNIAMAMWGAQTFKPSSDGKCTKIALKLFRNVAAANYSLEIRNTEGDGSPGVNILASKVFSSEPITESSPGQFYEFTFTTPPDLTSGVLYAIVLHQTVPDASSLVKFRRDATAPTYPDGKLWWSSNAGEDWTGYATHDYLFKTYRQIPGEKVKSGIVHIRHPALMSVVHKRGGVLVRGYDTLSSLDDEYLTGQVGVDVISGDFIQAITLPGIKYSYVVP